VFVAADEAQFRRVLLDAMKAAVKEVLTSQASVDATHPDPDAILSYEAAASLVNVKARTVAAWTGRGLLTRYKSKSGQAVGVKRAELLALFEAQNSTAPAPSTPDIDCRAADIVNGKRTRSKR
jgi:hypothetical protein